MQEYKVYITDNMSQKEENEVQSIITENHVSNGGNLFIDAIFMHNYAVLVSDEKGVVVGYALVSNEFIKENDIYVLQAAIKKDLQGKGIGTKIYDFIKKNSKPYSYFTASASEENIQSVNFHKKQGFEEIGYGGFVFDLSSLKNRKELKSGVSEKFSLKDSLSSKNSMSSENGPQMG